MLDPFKDEDVVLTPLSTLPGFDIVEILDLVYSATEYDLSDGDAVDTLMAMAKAEAKLLGGNAVLGFSMTANSTQASRSSHTCICTIVKLEPTKASLSVADSLRQAVAAHVGASSGSLMTYEAELHLRMLAVADRIEGKADPISRQM